MRAAPFVTAAGWGWVVWAALEHTAATAGRHVLRRETMEDIGMSPDYRSGISDIGTCHVCERQGRADLLERCQICGRPMCPDCRQDDETCVDCEE